MKIKKAWLLLAIFGICLAAAWQFQPRSSGEVQHREFRSQQLPPEPIASSSEGNAPLTNNRESDSDFAPSTDLSPIQAELNREDLSNPGQISIRSQSGEGLESKVVIIHDRAELRLEIKRASLVGDSLWENIIDAGGYSIHGELTVDRSALSVSAESLIMVFASGYAPYIQSLGSKPSFPIIVVLEPVQPIRVQVQDPAGNPISGAVVAVRSSSLPTANDENTLLEKIRWLYFQEVTYSDEKGNALFTTVLLEGNNIIVQPKNGFAAASVDNIFPGEALTIECDVAFQVHGRIVDHEGNPLPGARAKAYSDPANEFVFVNAGMADEKGLFTIDRLPASEPSIQLFASMVGYESVPITISLPTPGANYQHDFILHPAIGGTIQLVTNKGIPLKDTYISFYRSNADYVPGYYLTDQDGKAELRPVFRENFPYISKVSLGGLEIQLTEPFWAGEDSIITVPNLGRFTSWKLPADLSPERHLEYCIWTPDDSSVQGWSWWLAKDPCPWLTSGRGVFAARFSDGSCIEKVYVLENGDEASIELAGPSSFIDLQISVDSTASVYLYSGVKNNLFQLLEVSGPVHIPCDPGLYDLHVAIKNQPVIKLQGVQVPSGGIDLGHVGSTPNASVTVEVINAMGQPMPNCFVSLVPPGGFEATESWTNADGIAMLNSLSAGPYFLYCNSEATYVMQGREALASIQLLPGEQLEFRFEIGSMEGMVEVHVDSKGMPLPQGFFVNGHQRLSYHLPSNGMGSFPASVSRGFLGVTANRTGYALVAAKEIPPGPGVYSLERETLKTIRLHFHNESFEPQAGLKVGLYLAGQHLPYRPTTDELGELLLEIQPDIPLELEVWTPSGALIRFPVANLSTGQNILIPEAIARKRISFSDPSGNQIPGLRISGDGFPESIFPRREGAADIPIFPNRNYQAMASGFFPVTFDPNNESKIILPFSVGPLTFSLDEEDIEFLYIQSHSTLDSPLPLEGWARKTESGYWAFSSLPEGRITLITYAFDETVLAQTEIELTAERQHYSVE